MPTAVILGRVSTEDQGRRGYSLPEQLVECRKKARDMGATEILEFTDEISGEILDRPGLTAARELIRQGAVKWFVCLTADRLSRKLAHQLLLVEEMRRRQVQLVFAQHGYEDTAEGRFLLSVFGAVAELEKEKIRERTSRGRRGKYKTGKMAQYIDIFGYDLDTVADILVVNDNEATWVRQMYDWFIRERLGPYEIRDRLNDMGVPAPRGDQWHKSTVHRILTSATYTGTLVLNRKDWTGVSLNKHRPVAERVAPTWKDEAEWITITV
ncbi:MAG: cisA2, partial [Firmicutes bacterium]|nr:cisA2 [Bacillota bacterium]